MKKLLQIDAKKTHFFFIGSILILCVGFFIISCGSGISPQLKIQDSDRGPYALDFSICPPGTICSAIIDSKVFDSTSSIFDANKTVANKALTIEAWVNNQATTASATLGGIFARFDVAGIALYAKDGIAKAAIRRVVASGSATATADYIVTSGITLLKNVWYHIAGVLANSPHSHPANDCNANDADDNIHLDIYVNGQFEGCAATFGASNDPAIQPGFAGEPFTNNITAGVIAAGLDENLDGSVSSRETFPGIVDEVRLWGTARSKAQISNCRFQELSLDAGDCGRIRTDLISYMRFNEGTGHTNNDWAGLGSGIITTGIITWDTGWTSGAPISAKD